MKTSRWICAAALVAALPLCAGTWLPVVPGHYAPLFSGRDQDGDLWRSSDHLGNKALFLYFYAKDGTAGSSAEACDLRDNMFELKQADVDVAGVSFDSRESQKDFAFKYNLDFPLLSDPNGRIADMYGARAGVGAMMDRRVSFLIGVDGKVIHVTDSPDPAVHIRELRLALAKLRGKVAP